jgi:hypothetical protein
MISKGTSYYWKSTNLEDSDAIANGIIKSLHMEAFKISNGDLKRITSLSTNTCNT